MRVSVIRGEHQVEITFLGRSRQRLQHAAQVALELLGDSDATQPERSFGFSLSAETELTDDPD